MEYRKLFDTLLSVLGNPKVLIKETNDGISVTFVEYKYRISESYSSDGIKHKNKMWFRIVQTMLTAGVEYNFTYRKTPHNKRPFIKKDNFEE